ncbi:hypothetical protein PAMA_018197 [Pampus argenteus]
MWMGVVGCVSAQVCVQGWYRPIKGKDKISSCHTIMDLKIVFAIVCLCALSITSTEARIPKCCASTRNVHVQTLMRVERWDVQESNGACDISALILHVRGMKYAICAHPRVKKLLTWLKWMNKH